MPIKDSRLKAGTLTLDALPFATQATNVELTPKEEEDGDALETLSADTVEPDEVYTWTLDVEAVQDFDDPAGFVKFCLDNAGQVVPFSWKPNATAPTYTGTCRVRPVKIGGDVAKRLSTSASFPVLTGPIDTYPAP